MKYKIEIEYIAGGCSIPYFPNPFEFPGNSIDACNFRIKQVLDNNERGITSQNLEIARIFLNNEKTLEVNYREGKLELSDVINKESFWIRV